MLHVVEKHMGSPPAPAWAKVSRVLFIAFAAWGLQAGCGSNDPADPSACTAGQTETRACPDGSDQTRTCDSGSWGQYSTCPDSGSTCTDGATRDIVCPADSEGGVDTCQDGTWKETQSCTPIVITPPDCEDGSEDISCGINDRGVQTQVCADGEIIDPGTCADPDECEDGLTRNAACGANGLVAQACVMGQWSNTGSCEESCVDGHTSTTSCGINEAGTQPLRCTDGQWANHGACNDPDVCANGATDSDACGLNDAGTQALRCTNGQWANHGACNDPDVCVNGATDSKVCGLNDAGTQALRCTSGQWANNGACSDPDVCVNNAKRKTDCTSGGDFAYIDQTCKLGQWDGSTCWANSMDISHRFGCAVRNSGHVVCWGRNQAGQLGIGNTDDPPAPVNVKNLTDVTQVVTGNTFACALTATGQVYCWGSGSHGQIGNNSDADRSLPTKVPSLSNVKSLTAGHSHACAILENNTVSCWGRNNHGQLGVDSVNSRWTPAQALNLTDVVSIYADGTTTCAKKRPESGGLTLPRTSDVYCWGSNRFHGAGILTSVESILVPTKITQYQFHSVNLTGQRLCGLHGELQQSPFFGYRQRLMCVGRAGPAHADNNGSVTYTSFNASTISLTSNSLLQIKSGGSSPYGNACALYPADKSLRCWGGNDDFALGRGFDRIGPGTYADLATPKDVERVAFMGTTPIRVTEKGILGFAVHEAAVCVIAEDGRIACTGYFSPNANGTLANLSNVPPKP